MASSHKPNMSDCDRKHQLKYKHIYIWRSAEFLLYSIAFKSLKLFYRLRITMHLRASLQ